MYNISTKYVKACRRKVRKTVFSQYSKFKTFKNSFKKLKKRHDFDFDLKFNLKSHIKISARKKVPKLLNSYILSSKKA